MQSERRAAESDNRGSLSLDIVSRDGKSFLANAGGDYQKKQTCINNKPAQSDVLTLRVHCIDLAIGKSTRINAPPLCACGTDIVCVATYLLI